MDHDRFCEYQDLCEECHTEPEMKEKRKECNGRNCKKCGIYWEFHDGYFGLDEE